MIYLFFISLILFILITIQIEKTGKQISLYILLGMFGGTVLMSLEKVMNEQFLIPVSFPLLLFIGLVIGLTTKYLVRLSIRE